MITIADAGLGNFASVANMFNFLEIDVEIRKRPGEVNTISHLVLPGVGSFDTGMELLHSSGWEKAIKTLTPETKILGICLGMQLLTEGSEEGVRPGLGLIAGKCRRFDSKLGPVPQMGWNEIKITRENKIIPKDSNQTRFYFSNSYFVELSDPDAAFATANYTTTYCAAFGLGNIFGFQFHPEKSHQFGMKVLENFAKL